MIHAAGKYCSGPSAKWRRMKFVDRKVAFLERLRRGPDIKADAENKGF
jgi:hypothetical protein